MKQLLPLVAFAGLSGCVIPSQTTPMITPAQPAPQAGPAATTAAPSTAAPSTAPAPASTTAPATASAVTATGTTGGGAVTLTYTVPSGWTEQRGDQGVVLSVRTNSSVYQLAILPTITFTGSAVDAFRAAWTSAVGTLSWRFQPAPMRARTKAGYALYFDGDFMPGDGSKILDVYLLVSGDQAVPIVGLYQMPMKDLDDALAGFFASAALGGVAPDGKPLFTSDELAGSWTTQAVDIATYVDTAGNAVGDATLATYERFDLGSDGQFSSQFVQSRGSAGTLHLKDRGTWTVEDDTLVLHGGSDEKRHIIGVGQSPRGGTTLFLQDHAHSEDHTLVQPRDTMQASWFGHPSS